MTSRFSIAFAALSALFMAAPAAAQLSSDEQAMIRTIDSEQERTVAMLAKWVNQNSGTLNSPGVRAVGRMLRAELEPLGFKVCASPAETPSSSNGVFSVIYSYT